MTKTNQITDLIAETYFVGGDVIPALKKGDGRTLHVVIDGFGDLGRSMALTVAHICHFPGEGRRTKITIVDSDMEAKKSQFIEDYRNLFELAKVDGLLDIEWDFSNSLESVECNETDCVVIDCRDESKFACGDASHRFDEAKRVNFIYDQMQPVGKRHEDPESAWADLKEVHRMSSHFCALALHLRVKCFGLTDRDPASLSDEERHDIYDTEHRRWMTSALILGYATDNHNMIKYDELPADEKNKDREIIDNIHMIIGC